MKKTYKVYWRGIGQRTWKLSVSSQKPVCKEDADAICSRYESKGYETKVKEV